MKIKDSRGLGFTPECRLNPPRHEQLIWLQKKSHFSFLALKNKPKALLGLKMIYSSALNHRQGSIDPPPPPTPTPFPLSTMEDSKQASEQRKVSVFTVLKKGMIVKNIFLFNAPQPDFDPQTMGFGENLERNSEQRDGEEKEEILIVGRHPDCNLMLEHPSISRFHLRIHSKPSSQKLSVIDLSSAHGTWISDEKIEPMVLVQMNEGDTLR